jgi:anti-sigma B factor antagonist
MSLSIKFVGTEFVRLRIDGKLDVMTVPELEPMLASLVARQPWQVELELSRLRMLDTVGVGALIRFYKRLRMGGCAFTVTGLRDQPLAVFRLLRLDERWGELSLEPRWS